MALYKQSIDFLPKLSEEEKREATKVSRAGVYAAILPLLASIIWVLAMFIGGMYRQDVAELDATISQKNLEIGTYNDTRQVQTELILKVDALSEFVEKNFSPRRFFNEVTKTINSAGDAEAEIYAYNRDEDGVFSIEGRANSYLDLAKIVVVFRNTVEFDEVLIDEIYYNDEADYVNFKISFVYAESTEEAEI